MSLLSKIHWNVQTRCNLPCGFCYLWRRPTPIPMVSRVARQLIIEAAELADWFVFGGGDPLMRADIVDLIESAHDSGLRIDLHTNAVLLEYYSAARLMPLLSRMGLSLDGEDPTTHDRMRGGSENFGQVIKALELAEAFRIPTTIRTVVTRINRGHLAGLADLLNRFKCVEKWSLREFAPLGRGERTRPFYSLTRAEFLEECDSIKQRSVPAAKYSLATVITEEMENCFCLVSEEGFVYGHPTDGTYRSYGQFPREPLSVIMQRLHYDANKRGVRDQIPRRLSGRLAASV